MRLSSFRQWLTALIGTKPVATRCRSSVRLALDLLEDRITPSTLIVDQNSSDNNYHTIQSAVNAANPGDTIAVEGGTYTEQVKIAKNQLTVEGVPQSTGGSTNPALGAAGNYAVLYDGVGGHTLQITNVSVLGNVGVGGAGLVHYNGPGIIGGEVDFSASNSGQYSNNNSSNVGPTSVNYNVAAVTNAVTNANSLSSGIGGLAGTPIAINGNQTIQESAGELGTYNGYTYRVFTVTSYQEGNGNLLTITGDGSGDAVVFNFAKGLNLGGAVSLGGGLTNDQVIWNFTDSNKNVQLNNNSSGNPSLAYHGVILAPNDPIQVNNSILDGRVLGGGSQDLQINGNSVIVAGAVTLPTIQSPGFANPDDVNGDVIVQITQAQNVTFTNFNVNGDAGDTTQVGIQVANNASATISNNNVTNIVAPVYGNDIGGGAGIDIGTGSFIGTGVVTGNTVTGYGKVGIVVDGVVLDQNGNPTGQVSKASIMQNNVNGPGQFGIQVSNGASAQVSFNNVSGNGYAGVLVESAANNVVVSNNDVFSNQYGILAFYTNNIQVASNLATNNSNDGIQLQGLNGGQVTSNISLSNGGDGISVYGAVTGDATSAQNNQLKNNTINLNSGNGVTIQDATGTQVQNNSITNNGGCGISEMDTVNTQLQNNTINGNGMCGIMQTNTSNDQVQHNVISFNSGDGVDVTYSTGFQIQNNTIDNNGGEGVAVTNSTNFQVQNNTIDANASYGIGVIGSGGYQIQNNIVENNDGTMSIEISVVNSSGTVQNNTL